MSTASLDPVVARKLRHFGRRRLRLIVVRGFSAGIVTLLLCMAAVAATDWYWLLSDEVRWCLSGAAYLTVAAVVWWTCLRRMVHLPGKEVIAAQVEDAEPQLRENLLSAVELATDEPSAVHDSPVFRALLQGKVARLMGNVHVGTLLPARLVAKWVSAALLLTGVTVLLFTSGDPRFRQLASRAILPGANIARVSRIRVDVLQPTPHSLTMAEDETVAVVVEVTGGHVNEVTLETFTQNQGIVRRTMRGRTDIEFAANIHVADESVEYRILAGDAVTRKFTIESRPRPRVASFRKTYTYPEYAGLEPDSVVESHGNLTVLEGTRAELVLELDQEVAQAELRIDLADQEEMTIIPLSPVRGSVEEQSEANVLWEGTVPVDHEGVYKVHLVARDTGFENIFSPMYEIVPQPDLVPRAGFVDQQESTLLLPPTDIVALTAMAEDDLPLVSLAQHISINGQDWEEIRLDSKTEDGDDGRRLSAAWQWDLLSHQLKAGDQVTTKLVATDRKGNKGESIPLRIVVAAQDFDPQRHAVMERKVGLYDRLADFAELLQEHKESALGVIARLRQANRAEEENALDHKTLLDLAAKQGQQAGQLLDEIKDVEREMPAGADAYDLDLTGRVAARLQQEHSNTPAFLLRAVRHTEDEKQVKNDLDALKRVFERTADDAKNMASHYQQLMSHNFLNALALDLDALLLQQRMVVNSPTQTWERLVRHENVVINQLRVLENIIAEHAQRLPHNLENKVRALQSWAGSYRDRIEGAMESEDKLDELRRVSQDFLKQIEHKQRVDALDGGLPNRMVGLRRDFDHRSGSLYVPLFEIGRAIQQENSLTAKASDSPDSAEGKAFLEQAKRYVAEVDFKRRSVGQLRVRRELTQTRRDSDAQYAADAGLTHRAVGSLLNQHRRLPPAESQIPQHLLEIAPAYRTLEAGHYLIGVRDALNVLLNMERWWSQDIRSHMDHPRQWDVVHEGFALASQRLREAGIERGLVARLDQLRTSGEAREAARKITQRRYKRDAMVSAGHELVALRDELATVVDELQPVMAEARAIIANYAPTIPEMAQQAADQLREMEVDTLAVADAAESPQAPQTEPQVKELKERQTEINEQLKELAEALVEDANSQDLLNDEQRERARDADNSIAMIQEPARQMNEAMQRAQESSSAKQQAKELAQASEQQELTAQALELVADHFEQLEKGMDVAESRARLREVDSALARQMDQQFDNAEQLAAMANQNREDLMAELEAELQRNPAMQEALAEISKNALQEARNALEYAAQEDGDLQRANERSDQAFQAKKKELADALRTMGAEASRLSDTLVARANQAAARGKAQQAREQFAETQQQLKEGAAKASSARDDQLLAELAQKAHAVQAALSQAKGTLKQAKDESASGKNEKIHADGKAREAAKKEAESSRQQFHEQQKKLARDIAKQTDSVKKRADSNARRAESQLRSADRRVQQAKRNLARKPEDANLKRNLAREEARRAGEQKKVAAAKQAQVQAKQAAEQARQASDELNRKQLPTLDAPNPSAQLAEQYANEAMDIAEELSRRAEQLAAEVNFGEELSPAKNQLAAAEKQQQGITQDVHDAARDVARAARHERRLENDVAPEPLQEASQRIQQVADDESSDAAQQINRAVGEAEQTEGGGQAPASENREALAAQQSIEAAENAIAEQAEQLSQVLEALTAATAASSPAAESPGDTTAPAGNQTAPTRGEATRAEQLARTLDELDRRQASAAALARQDAQPGQPAPSGEQPAATPETLAQAARAQQADMAASRALAQQQAALAMSETAAESSNNPATAGLMTDFDIVAVNRDENGDWGRLRSKSADDLTKGRSEAVSEAYRKSVSTYFRVLAERARSRK